MLSHLSCPCLLFQATSLRWEHLLDSVNLINFLLIHLSVQILYSIPSPLPLAAFICTKVYEDLAPTLSLWIFISSMVIYLVSTG